MTTEVHEKLGNEIIRKFFGLKTRPAVSADIEAVHKKITGHDKTKDEAPKEEPLDQPLK